jgi:hypothetical protein
MSLSRLFRFRPCLSAPKRFFSSENKGLFYPQAFQVEHPVTLRPHRAPASFETLKDKIPDYEAIPSSSVKKWMQSIAESKTVLTERTGWTDEICKEHEINSEHRTDVAAEEGLDILAKSLIFPRSLVLGPLLFKVDTAAPDYAVWQEGDRHVARTLFATYDAKVNSVYKQNPWSVLFGAVGFRVSAIWSPIMPKRECSALIERASQIENKSDRLRMFDEMQNLMQAYDSPTARANTARCNTRDVFAIKFETEANPTQSRLSFAYDAPTKVFGGQTLTMGSYHLVSQTWLPNMNGGMIVKLHLRVDPNAFSGLTEFTADQTSQLRKMFATSFLLHSKMI